MLARFKDKKRSLLLSYFMGYGTSAAIQFGTVNQNEMRWMPNLAHVIEGTLEIIVRSSTPFVID